MITRDNFSQILLDGQEDESEVRGASLEVAILTGGVLCDIRDALTGIHKELWERNHPPVVIKYDPDLTEDEMVELRTKFEKFGIQPGKLQLLQDDGILNRYKLALRSAVTRIHNDIPTGTDFEKRLVDEDVELYLAQAKDEQSQL